ncbi:hypothetical protein KC939_02685, partial [Candidatus Saccharibacteria bacterium]|nr:hypothetical protein [Candidatus Saccharibacteria bacterium]
MIEMRVMDTITVYDFYQTNYRYELSENPGKHFHSDFTPELTPKEMLKLGIFGGLYMSDMPKEFPKDWFAHAKLSPDKKQHKELNYF